ncbi:hypothetical protein ACRALDRAFT_1082321 [Sodiomyces alcalophilus JCM 7366]|uniref:uncharacterized protein n=1 Tax=Sodiomyces alcalophilus JCM 7366 TaxID=591952 RepID=UPI0039B39C02
MYNRYIPPSRPKQPAPPPAQSPPPESSPPPSRLEQTNAVDPLAPVPYARYIPPRKPKAVIPPSTQTDEHAPAESPSPKKRKHATTTPAHDSSPAPVSKKSKTSEDVVMKDDSDVPESPKKDKKKTKKKKDKKDKKAKGDDEDAAAPESVPPDTPSARIETNGDAGDTSSRTLTPDDLGDSMKERTSVEDEQKDDSSRQKEKKPKKPKKDKKKKASELDDREPEEDGPKSRHASILAKKAKSLAIAPELGSQTETAEPIDPDAQPKTEDAGKHGLEPLPQPKPVEVDTSKPTYDTLPPWLASPIRVGPDTRTPFRDIGIHSRAAKFLETKGFKDAFAVQAAAIPLLLPSCKHRQGDVLVAAATGSGKTLAYALPIVRDISQGTVTRLRALVVLPTRELVSQAYEVFKLCTGAFDGREEKRVRIGISVGSHQLKQEQANLVEKTERYDPEAYREALQRGREAWKVVEDDDADPEAAAQATETKPLLGDLPDHIVEYNSKIDILLCTPGRLVDHVRHTPGFTLDYVRWLVVDEADKLLAQSFQGWLDVVMPRLRTATTFSARDFPDSNLTGVRKLVLSATLTRDLSLLSGLQLRRPQLIVLEGADADGRSPQTAEHTLPGLLEEFAVRVHDPNLKPLYLLELLQGDYLLSPESTTSVGAKNGEKVDEAEDTTSDEGSDTSSSDSDSSSDAESGSDTSSKSAKDRLQKTVLIFTKSNEAALRLSRLLTLLQPSWEGQTATLTSTQKTSHRRRILASFATGSTRLLVASDLVARGIDLPTLDNVVNYDLPAGPAAYVHRVGRTARAGQRGRAFSLVEARESGWFWGAVAKWEGIVRSRPVARLMIGATPRPEGDGEARAGGEEEKDVPEPARFEEEKMAAYEKALEELGREAGQVRKRA